MFGITKEMIKKTVDEAFARTKRPETFEELVEFTANNLAYITILVAGASAEAAIVRERLDALENGIIAQVGDGSPASLI